jgi:hypothetical protein
MIRRQRDLPVEIQASLNELSQDVPQISKSRTVQLLKSMEESFLSDLVIFEDDGDIVLHWTGHAIYCDFMKDSDSYRAGKVVQQAGDFVSNVVFHATLGELLRWITMNFE